MPRYKPNSIYDKSSEDTGCLVTMGVLIMVAVMPIAGPLAAMFTYLLVIGVMEPTSELLRYLVVCWGGYLLCVWISMKTIYRNHWNHPYTNRFALFLKVAIAWLGVVVGGLVTLGFVIQIVFPQNQPMNIREGLLAIAFLTAGTLLFRTISGGPQDPEDYGQYPEDWDDIRQIVLERDDYRCANCQSTENLHVHHIVPLSLGGSNELSNLKTLCKRCHTTLHPHMRD